MGSGPPGRLSLAVINQTKKTPDWYFNLEELYSRSKFPVSSEFCQPWSYIFLHISIILKIATNFTNFVLTHLKLRAEFVDLFLIQMSYIYIHDDIENVVRMMITILRNNTNIWTFYFIFLQSIDEITDQIYSFLYGEIVKLFTIHKFQ
jgi:hypothetical protein